MFFCKPCMLTLMSTILRVFDKRDAGCLSDETILRILAHTGDDKIPPEEATQFLHYLKAQVAPRELKIGTPSS